MQDEQVLDRAVVAELRRAQDAYGDDDFIRQLVRLFRDKTPGKMDRIREALAAGDAGAIVAVAHTLKTNCAMLGAARMADACDRVETAAGQADFAAAGAAFSNAEAQLPLVLTALADLTQTQ